MSDYIIEIEEPIPYILEISSDITDNESISIEVSGINTVSILSNEVIFVSDLPEGYPISWTVGDLPVSRLSGIVGQSGVYYSNGYVGLSGIPYNLIPVHNIISGSGINVTSNSGIFSIAVTGQFGLTGEQVDDRISNLLVAGSYAQLNYNDNNDQLTISVTGLQPSGNYSVVGHGHVVADVSGLQNILDNKQPSGIYASGIHYHNSSDITNFDGAVDSRISLANLQPSGNYSIVGHTHVSSNISDFNSSVSGLLPVKNISPGSGILVTNNSGDFIVAVTGQFGLTGEQVDDRVNDLLVGTNNIVLNYDDNLDKLTISTSGLQPSGNYSVVGHSHSISDVSGLQSALDNKQPSGSYAPLVHSHTSSNITDFSSSVNNLVSGVYAPLNSPSFSGVATVPTAPGGTNSTQIANTQFVRSEISNLVNSAPSTLDTLNELATALGNDPNFATTIVSGLGTKANLSGAVFTGSITIPSGNGNFNTLTVNNIAVSVSGHSHITNDIVDFYSSVSGIVNSGISTSLVAGTGISLDYYSNNDTLMISTSGVSLVGHKHVASEINDFDAAVKLIKLNDLAVPTGTVNFNNQRLINVGVALSGTDGINKNYIDNLLATTGIKGIASFDSGDFSVTSGVVSIKTSGIDNNQLAYSSIILGSTTMNLGSTYVVLNGVTIDGGSP